MLRLLRWLGAAVVGSPGVWTLGAGLAFVWAFLSPLIRLHLTTDVPGLVSETLWLVSLGALTFALAWLREAEPQLRSLPSGTRLAMEGSLLAAAGLALILPAVLLLLVATPARGHDIHGLLLPLLFTLAHLVGLALVLHRLPFPSWLAPALFLALAWLVPALQSGAAAGLVVDASAHLDAVGGEGRSLPKNLLAVAPIAGLFAVSALLMSPYSRGN